MMRYFYFIPFAFVLFCLTGCQTENATKKPSNTLRISTEEDIRTLDPRLAHTLHPITAIHMLYEGLMQTHPDGIPVPALAESVTVSPDQVIYAFKLRPAHWSNGDPVTAHDFENTWKSLLSPTFISPNAYLLFPLKGAKDAKEGRAAVDTIGVHALDDQTLVVELEEATPHFLNLLTTHFYFPVHSTQRALNDSPSFNFPTNGPFQLSSWIRNNELIAKKNPEYWDKQNVSLDEVHLQVLDNSTALQLFEKGYLEWVGSPLGKIPSDAQTSLRDKKSLQTTPAAGLYLTRLNTKNSILSNQKIRQALSLALNRESLVNHVLQGGQLPAYTFVPPSLINNKPLFSDNQIDLARSLFQEGLKELNSKDTPSLSISYSSSDEQNRRVAQVLQQQWKEALGLKIVLAGTESKMHYEKIKKGEYQIGMGNWSADISDPLSFLEVFKLKNNGTNNTGWEDPHYIALLNQSSTQEGKEREILLKEAEAYLVQESPMIPLFFGSYLYLKDPKLEGVYFSDLGWLDLKNAHFVEKPATLP